MMTSVDVMVTWTDELPEDSSSPSPLCSRDGIPEMNKDHVSYQTESSSIVQMKGQLGNL